MKDQHYQSARLAELYDYDSPWSVDRDFYLALAGESSRVILDLGCGTGLLCNAYAERGHHVTGADPSNAMLEVARKKPFGSAIEWIQASAQSFRSSKRFDLIIMTGHAFQVLLEDADVRAAFSTMREHLKPGGKIVFESRNPAIDWSKHWNYEMRIDLPTGSVVESRKFIAYENAKMTFDLIYQFPDETLVSNSELRFLTEEKIEQLIHEAGLKVDTIFGDWHGGDFTDRESEEMIFVVRRN